MKKILKDTLALLVITLVAGLLLGIVYQITKEPIAKQNENAKLNAYRSVFEQLDKTEEISETDIDTAQKAVKEAGYSTVTVNEAVKAYDASGKYLGLIITVTDAGGYGGNIKMTVGIDSEAVITGLEFLEISETAGLGMKAKEAKFKNQFIGMNTEYVQLTKTGATADYEFDAISSATITSRSVENGVNGALVTYRTLGGADSE